MFFTTMLGHNFLHLEKKMFILDLLFMNSKWKSKNSQNGCTCMNRVVVWFIQDAVIHVRDISHPDTQAQRRNVLTTLQSMLPEEKLATVIEVCNKADLLSQWVVTAEDHPRIKCAQWFKGTDQPKMKNILILNDKPFKIILEYSCIYLFRVFEARKIVSKDQILWCSVATRKVSVKSHPHFLPNLIFFKVGLANGCIDSSKTKYMYAMLLGRKVIRKVHPRILCFRKILKKKSSCFLGQCLFHVIYTSFFGGIYL